VKKRFALLLLIITILLVPGRLVVAQNAVIFTSLEIDMWPEYDRPEMLVIYRIELSPEVPLPADVSIQIPAAAGEPNAVAVRDPNGSLLNAPFERDVNGDWAIITLTASMPGIQIEYYDPRLITDGFERNYELNWMGDYPTESLIVKLQQPLGAEEVLTVPGATSANQGSDGLTYHIIDLGPQPAGLTTDVTISYVKDTDTLSVERFNVQPSAPISGTTSGRVTIMDVLPWGLGVIGILLLIGGLWWYWQTGRGQHTPQRSSRGRRSRGKRSPHQARRAPKADQGTTVTADKGVYCHQCGKRAETGDRFCRSCGTKLREF
jgi:hypothetical protein